MIQLRGLLGRLLGPLLKTGLPLTKSVIKPLTKSFLIPLRLTASASAAGAASHNHPSSTTLVISNDEREDIVKIVKSLEYSGLLLKGTETAQNEAKEQKGEFLSMLLGTLGAGLLGNILAGQGINREGKGRRINRAGEVRGIVRAGYRNKKGRKNNIIDF